MRFLAAAAFLFRACGAWAAPSQEELLREAARLDAQGRCEEAERRYEQAQKSGPASPALLNNLGNHYLACGQPGKAERYFEQLLKLHPAHPNANLQLARLAVERKQGAKALGYLARVADTSPAVRLLRAEALHWAGRAAEARAVLEALEREAGGDLRLQFTLGATYARLGAFDRAEAAFERVLVQRPADFDVLFHLGRAAARAGNWDRARQALEAALKLRPDDAEALFELGLAHAARKESSRAVYLLAQARQRAPHRPDIVLALARAAEDAGFYGDSALAYDEYLTLRPDDVQVRRDRARVLGYTGTRLQEGLREMNWYVTQFPRDPAGYFNLAQFTWRDEPDKSLEQLATALRLDPNFAAAHVARAWLLRRLGRAAEAVPHLEAALKVAPNDLRTLDLLGLVYLDLDQPAAAEPVLRRALAIQPEDPEVLLHLGRALMALGRPEEARAFMEKYQQVRPRWFRDPRREPGMIELATLPEPERRQREIERFRRMAAARPDDPKLQLHLAELLLASGRIPEGLAEFRKLLEMNADGESLLAAGRSLLHAEHYREARRFLERAAADRPAARLDLALAVLFTDGPERALEALGEPPPGEITGDSLLLKAILLDAAGRLEEAAGALREAVPRAAGRPDVARRAALLLVRRGKLSDALAVAGGALRTSPEDAELLLLEAALLGLAGRKAEAEGALRRLQARRPEWDLPYLIHGLLIEQSRPEAAREKFETAVALGSREPAAACALARLKSLPPAAGCDCWRTLEQFLMPACQNSN
jgi:Flp pilus assembly protein TadD